MSDCEHWYGLKFNDLDCPHWLPYMDGNEIGQPGKLTIPFNPATEEQVEDEESDEDEAA